MSYVQRQEKTHRCSDFLMCLLCSRPSVVSLFTWGESLSPCFWEALLILNGNSDTLSQIKGGLHGSGIPSVCYHAWTEYIITAKIHGKCVCFLRFRQCLNMIQRKWQHLLYTQSKFYSFCILSESLKWFAELKIRLHPLLESIISITLTC